MSSQWEFKLTDGQSLKGEVYCADQDSDLVVLQDAEGNISMVSVAMIESAVSTNVATTIEAAMPAEASHLKKTLEDREKRAIRMAQESLKHLNPKVRRKRSEKRMCVLADAMPSCIVGSRTRIQPQTFGESDSEPVYIFAFCLAPLLV